MGFMNRLRKANPVSADKLMRKMARKQFDKRGECCEHDPKHVCDACLEEAISISKGIIKQMPFKEKMRILKGGKYIEDEQEMPKDDQKPT